MSDSRLSADVDYGIFLEDLKVRIRAAQVRAAVSVTHELVMLYWSIGREILFAQNLEGYGAKIVSKMSSDLTLAFPEMKGFSPRNLNYMLAFAKAWDDHRVLQQLVAKLSWGHNNALLEKLDTPELREWYAKSALEHGWSRNVLALQIKSRLHERQGAAAGNFAATLPAPQSDLAQNLLKDPYNFDFLSIGCEAHEREIENALVVHVRKFLLELGVGFAFVGSQYHIEVADEDFYIDLLFYHVRLHCYVVIELKATKFKPEYAGKLNFYLSAVDDLLRTEGDGPTIGLILCRDKNRVLAEYALRDISKPIGVSTYDLGASLPDEIKTALPTIEQIEQELSGAPDEVG